MSYKIVKCIKQVEAEGKEIDDCIYIPIDTLWDDYTILSNQKILFIDSPLNNLDVVLLHRSGNNTESIKLLQEFLEGAGCKVHVLGSSRENVDKANLVIVIDSQEGVFQTGYGGFMVNGSKKLAKNISWSLARYFELDFVASPKKVKIPVKFDL